MARSIRVFLALAALVPLAASGASVYLNNVNIDGVTNQKFERATVRIDERGNVFIDAPGYSVKALDGKPPPPPGPQVVQKKYWLVTEQTATGFTDYDIDVYVNSKWVRKLRNGEDQIITELTKHMVPGPNTVLLAAKKLPANGARKSLSPEHVFRVIIGEGTVSNENVVIDNPLVKFERKASDTTDNSKEFTINAR